MNWIESHIPPWVFIAIIAHAVVLLTVAYLILLERKVASWVQDRLGPNRVGLGFGIVPGLKDLKMKGLGQPLADGLKFIFKEDYRPAGVDKILFTVAPIIMMAVVVVSIAVIPFAGIKQTTRAVPTDGQSAEVAAQEATPVGATFLGYVPAENGQVEVTYRYPFQIARLNIGALFVIAILSLAIYGVVLGGWASNNKYSFLGALRATAQMISYEIPLGLSLLCIVVMYGTLELGELVDKQAHYWISFTAGGHHFGLIPAWNVFTQPLAFLMFLVCIHAEANRAPFDLAEAEQELVGGYHTEYSSMRFALFFLAEYAGMITTSCVCVALFFGGWHFWGLNGPDPNHPSVTSSGLIIFLRCLVYFLKVLGVIFVFMWVRWSLPRFRFDQLMMLAWRALIPISLGLLMVTAVVVYFVGPRSEMFRDWRHFNGWSALIFLASNVVLLGVAMFVSTLLPPPPETNRRLIIPGSRFNPRIAANPALTTQESAL